MLGDVDVVGFIGREDNSFCAFLEGRFKLRLVSIVSEYRSKSLCTNGMISAGSVVSL